MKKIWFLIVIVGIFCVCILYVYLRACELDRQWEQDRAALCSPFAWDFSEADLAGTWVSGFSGHWDTLYIRTDGTYRQVVHIELTEGDVIDYESDWQSWYLEYSDDNLPYLHLTGMRFCGMNPDIPCDRRNGGGHDFCRDERIEMNGEGILLVLNNSDIVEIPEGATRQAYISLFYPMGSENFYAYGYRDD